MSGKGKKPWAPPERLTTQKPVISPQEDEQPRRQPVADCVVEEVPATCPTCQSTDREQMEGTITRNISGVTRDGRIFNRVRWAYCTCRKCFQRYRVIRRENAGD